MSSSGILRYSSNGQRGIGTVTLNPPSPTRAFAAVEHPEAPQARILREFEEASLRLVERRFHPGDTVYATGDPDDKLYFLLSGTVRFFKTYGYCKEATTALLTDRGIFGGPDLVDTGPQVDFAEALTEVRLAQVRKSSVVW